MEVLPYNPDLGTNIRISNLKGGAASLVDQSASVPSENNYIFYKFVNQILNEVHFIKSTLSSEKYGNFYHHRNTMSGAWILFITARKVLTRVLVMPRKVSLF